MKTTLILEILNSLTRQQLRDLAKRFEVKRGRNRSNTLENLAKAIQNDSMRLALEISIKPAQTNSLRVFGEKLYSYKASKTICPVVFPTPTAIPSSNPQPDLVQA